MTNYIFLLMLVVFVSYAGADVETYLCLLALDRIQYGCLKTLKMFILESNVS